ncbi:hypothetical protein ABK040_003294 [Willaertia magna]
MNQNPSPRSSLSPNSPIHNNNVTENNNNEVVTNTTNKPSSTSINNNEEIIKQQRKTDVVHHVFTVKAKKTGNIIIRAREVYTRDDIYCQSRSCKKCKHTNPILDEQQFIIVNKNKKINKMIENNNVIANDFNNDSIENNNSNASGVNSSNNNNVNKTGKKKNKKNKKNIDLSNTGNNNLKQPIINSWDLKKKEQQQINNSKPLTNNSTTITNNNLFKVEQQEEEEEKKTIPSFNIHYIFPTFEVIQKYLEIFEVSILNNIIFCETITQHLQNATIKQSNKIISRIYTIISDKTNRKSILFSNEHAKSTFVKDRLDKNESIEMRNERAILTCAYWYAYHLKHVKIKMLVICLDKEQKERLDQLLQKKMISLNKEEEEKKDNVTTNNNSSSVREESIEDVFEEGLIQTITLKDYLEEYKKNEKKVDMIQLYDNITISKENETEDEDGLGYTEYLPMDVLEQGLNSNRFYKGVLRVNQFNSREAFVKSSYRKEGIANDEEETIKILIPSNADRNRSVHNDVVVVELKPKSEWKKRNNDNNNNQVLEPTGRVVGVLERKWRDYVACLEESTTTSGGDYLLTIPIDPRIPKIRIKTRQRSQLENQRIIVRISDWERKSRYPNGFYVRTLGPIGDLDSETEGLLVENQLTASAQPFSQFALSELPPNDFIIPQSEISKRRDIRKTHLVCSIDPIGCEDIDDALSVKRLTNGNVEVGVHIADVSYFVKYDGYLDLEARRRSTTVYLIDRRLDMIPSLLSANLCSLHMKRDRLAVSVFWEFDKEGNVVNTWYGRTVLNSRYSLHYEQADEIIKGSYSINNKERKRAIVEREGKVVWEECQISNEDLPALRKDLTTLQQLATTIQKKRLSEGALELNDLEAVTFKLDSTAKPVEIQTKDDLLIHHTVAEWMIFANAYVAKRIYDSFPTTSCLRRHPYPLKEKFNPVIKAAASRGFEINLDSSISLSKSLEEANDPEDKFVNLLIRALTTRAMSEAEYFSTGTVPVSDFIHYGLALPFYTHFTSPIRRYADIIVHRLLLWAINNDKNPFTTLMLDEMCKYMNNIHRQSKQAQMDSSAWFKANYFKDHKDAIEDAIIFNLKENALYVFVPTYRIKGIIYITTKEGEFIVPEKEQELLNLSEKIPMISGETTNGDVNISFTEQDIRNIELVVTLRKAGNSSKRSNVERFDFRIFDHVQVKISVDESRSHLPSVKLNLVTLKTNKKVRNVKENLQQVIANEQQQQNQLKKKQTIEEKYVELYKEQKQLKEQQKQQLESMSALSNNEIDLEYMQSQGGLYKFFQQLNDRNNTTIKTNSTQLENEEIRELTKKKKVLENRLRDITNIKEKVKNENAVLLTEQERERLLSEEKYEKNLRLVEKKLSKLLKI